MSQGFYKYSDGQFYHGPNFVSNSSFEILKENKDDYIYPVEGWYWFDSREEALFFFGIEDPDIEEEPEE